MLEPRPSPQSQATSRASRPGKDRKPLQVVVGLYNQCLAEALCRFLRNEDPNLLVSQVTEPSLPDSAQIYLTDLPTLASGRHPRCPDARIIVIDEGLDLYQQQSVFRHPGVCGLIRHDCSDQLLVKAIRCVAGGELWIDGETVKQLLSQQPAPPQPGSVHLTRKERQITDLVLQGLKNKAIAAEVYLSESTVKVYLSRIFRKFSVKNRCQLIAHLTQPSSLH